MIKLILMISLYNKEEPFELILEDNTKYSFNYGFRHENWGTKNTTFQIHLTTRGPYYTEIISKYSETIFPYLKNYENIKEISLTFFNENNSLFDEYKFQTGEIDNLNLQKMIDDSHDISSTISFNILKNKEIKL